MPRTPDAKIQVTALSTRHYEARIGRKVVGRVSVWNDLDGDFCVFRSYVHAGFRRRGVATALYSKAESDAGQQLVPKLTSEDAFRFWCAYRPQCVANDLRHRQEELLGRAAIVKGRDAVVVTVGSGTLTMRYLDMAEGAADSQTTLLRRELDAYGLGQRAFASPAEAQY